MKLDRIPDRGDGHRTEFEPNNEPNKFYVEPGRTWTEPNTSGEGFP